MKKNHLYFSIILSIIIAIVSSCGDDRQNNIFQRLEIDAGISTFPLTVVIADQLRGEAFPEDIQSLCMLSKSKCKTLPLSGVLRLGPDQYYTYNCVSEIDIPGSLKDNEAAVTELIEKKVNTYLALTRLKNYDSLLIPANKKWNMQKLSLNYLSNTSDSIFFFSNVPNTPSPIQVGNRQYEVYTNMQELRRNIDALICTKNTSISVFYNPAGFTPAAVSGIKNNWPKQGANAGDTCIGQSKYVKLHNGSGGFTTGKLIELNSKSCGFAFPTGVAGDTCVSGSKYQKLHNGRGGFSIGTLVERNSRSCGFAFPTGVAGDTCVSGSKYQKLHNGRGGFSVGRMLERNSKSCGFAFPTGVAGDTCVRGSKYQKLHNGRGGFSVGRMLERNSKSCGFAFPTGVAGDTCVRGSKYQKLHNGRGGFSVGRMLERNSKSCGFAFPTGVAGDTCVRGSKYQKLHNGRGGFSVGRILERNSKSCGFSFPAKGTRATGSLNYRGKLYERLNDGNGGFLFGKPLANQVTQEPTTEKTTTEQKASRGSNRCVTRSEPACEKDERGNYTGRRVQYCYDKNGSVIQTIVLSKCETDCRCLGY